MSKMLKNASLEKVIFYWIPVITLQFLTALPTRQDSAKNRDEV